jgi:sensor histidine kinase YesM
MKNRLNTIAVHIVIWTLLFLVPYLSTYRVIHKFLPKAPLYTYAPMVVLSSFLITIFYVNYFLLIPKYLLERRYGRYAVMLGLCLGLGLSTSVLIFELFGFDPAMIDKANPILATISPIAQANAFLMLIIGIVTSILLAMNNRLKQTEEEKLSAQIASLQSQINPHFLFNTLNNIYATAIDTSPQTAEMVAQLSEMMRYSMRDIQKDLVDLGEEIGYIDNYIALQQMRLDRKVKLDYLQEGNFSGFEIAPMLLISFIENAFKHGVNAEEHSHISIRISMRGHTLDLHVRNNKVHVQSETSVHSGLGIANTRSRLKLIYPRTHVLTIQETDATFDVSLQITLP